MIKLRFFGLQFFGGKLPLPDFSRNKSFLRLNSDQRLSLHNQFSTETFLLQSNKILVLGFLINLTVDRFSWRDFFLSTQLKQAS